MDLARLGRSRARATRTCVRSNLLRQTRMDMDMGIGIGIGTGIGIGGARSIRREEEQVVAAQRQRGSWIVAVVGRRLRRALSLH